MTTRQKSKSRPVIGVTCSRIAGGAWSSYSLGHFQDFAFHNYSNGVLACGGAPLLIPIGQNRSSLAAICDRLDGVILGGGPDINPRLYGQEPMRGLKEVDEEADRTAVDLTALSLERDLPLLGICRGIQVLNVALGGTLYQDLPTELTDGINHNQAADRATPTHSVLIESGTRLRGVIRRRKIWVNSKHHQGVKDLAPELIPAARAADGLIEAVESPSHRFALAVQWHPEGMWPHDLPARRLFAALVEAGRAPAARVRQS